MRGKCRDEVCWAKKADIDTSEIFKPEKPKEWEKNSLEWLDTNNIEDVLSQYEKKHSNFALGAVPIDFDHRFSPTNCVNNELCNLSVKRLSVKMIQNYMYLTRPSRPTSSHWISMFARSVKNHSLILRLWEYVP